MARKNNKTNSQNMGIPHALRDVLVASINKGQFPLAVMALIFGIIILRLPPEDLSKLVFEVFNMLKKGEMIGYPLSLIGFGGWYIHVKWQRKMITNEMKRISVERTRAQNSKLGKGLIKSSEEAQ